ncbi:MAG: UDP-3-O-[3-hydroxymyristoyl] N-acetylglucosamine deacetylase [Omnitrophica bacterium RBG_13_46_9]|nr:MAG: UDP-3-O-[3-hydroxymyristoyl] N-acetylglucosamine deacetylase [Omnitrophica bacterium RBG_13_46_9]
MEEQKTIAKDFFLEGKGLQTGKSVKAFFYPEKENEGIIFRRTDLEGGTSVRLKDLSILDTDRRSKIGFGQGNYVETVEHVLAALWGAGIDNIRIELDGSEMPALDGSAVGFLEAIKKSGIRKQSAPREVVEIKEPLWAEDEKSFLGIFPSNAFKVSYLLEYPSPAIGRQFFSSVLDPDLFQKEIAPARTFCLKEEAEALLKQGYGRGADLENTLVMDTDGPMDNTLRFADEPVRHKVLDLIGDLYLLGRPIKARVIAIRSGHRLNLELVRKVMVGLCR